MRVLGSLPCKGPIRKRQHLWEKEISPRTVLVTLKCSVNDYADESVKMWDSLGYSAKERKEKKKGRFIWLSHPRNVKF